jgi:hypothetical protein
MFRGDMKSLDEAKLNLFPNKMTSLFLYALFVHDTRDLQQCEELLGCHNIRKRLVDEEPTNP